MAICVEKNLHQPLDGQSPATTAMGRTVMSVSSEVDGGLGTTAQAACLPAARDASELGDAAAPTSSLSAAAACASTSASNGARETVANPRPLCLQQRPRMLMHDRAACRLYPLVWERAPWLAK